MPGSTPSFVRAALRALHRRSRGSALLHRLAVGSRVLLCVGFLPTGMVKLLGRPFTRMGPETPVGLFFHAMHQTGIYWQFLGATQVLAAVLVVIPATRHLGALLFFPILVNIALITIGVGFGGTVYITVPMCLAALLLVCWEYDRWEAVVFRPAPSEPFYAPPPPRVPLSTAERVCYGVGLAAGLYAFTGFRLSTGPRSTWIALGLAFLAAVAAVALGLAAAWRARETTRGRREAPA
jgi:hypothetical protein